MLKKWVSSILAFTMIFGSANFSSVLAESTPIYMNQSATDDARVSDLLGKLTLDEKIGQMVQAERGTATPADVKEFSLGSILSGGGSVPTPNTPTSWADMTDSFQEAAASTEHGIPILYGVDAVHGHNNVVGATVFPHNIGLAASKNVSLVEKIGQATAEEVRSTGANWSFSTTLGIPHNERWGRTYETFGENTQLVSSLGSAYIKGLQGDNPDITLKRPDTIIATAKHFLGEGLATDGTNQGNSLIPDSFNADGTVKVDANGALLDNTILKNELLPPYKAAISAGVRTIMVSYNSINGVKCHGNADVITKILKGDVSKGGLGFTGIVVSDWEGIAQVAGDNDSQKIKASINAGMDMAMVPNTWKTFINDLKILVNNGEVTEARINDAVTRILKVKFEMGLFEDPYAQRDLLGTVGSVEHRDIARQAVRESLVLLKNDNDIVGKLKDKKSILVAGKNADDIGIQSGGWTISWQGQAGNVTPGTTILQGIKNTVGSDVKVGYNKNGVATGDYDVAIVVIGESPYAETDGDKTAAALTLDATDLATIKNIKTDHPDTEIVAVLVSGRPITIADQINNLDGIVEAWLPGSEGQGVAEVLFGSNDFIGKLPITWPWYATDIEDKLTDPSKVLFNYGYGLKKGNDTTKDAFKLPTKPELPVVPDTSISVPGQVEAEAFTSGNGKTETCEEGGLDVGSIDASTSMNYSVNVQEDGLYQLDLRVAVADPNQWGNKNGCGATLSLGSILLTTVNFPLTVSNGWQNFATISTTSSNHVNLKGGKQTLTFKATANGFNFNWMKFTKVGDYVEPPVPTPATSTGALITKDAVSVTMSSAVQAASQSWYDSAKEIPNKLSSKAKLDITLPGTSAEVTTIKVDGSKKYQTILGMGTSIEGSTIANLNKLSPAVKTDFLKKLVDPTVGAGMSLMRVTIGTPDFTGDVFHTYFDKVPGATGPDWNNTTGKGFSIKSDIDDGTIATIKETLKLNPNIKLFASSWTPPGWMKEETSSSKSFTNTDGLLLRGGKLSDAHINDLAMYYTRYLEEYAKLGIPIYAMTLQNEPLLEINYPSCLISSEQERLLSLAIKKYVSDSSILKAENINPKIWAFDHNFDGATSYVPPILDKENGVDGIAFHPYGGVPTSMTQIHNMYTNTEIHLTERAVWGTKGADEIANYFRNYAQSYTSWVTMLDSNISPHQWVGSPDPTMFVRDANTPDSYWACPEYYITGQFSKFVRPGAVRIDSNYGSSDTVTNVSFMNTDGTIATVVINQTDKDQTFKILNNGTQILATIPAQNVATYQWTPDTSIVLVPDPILASNIAANAKIISKTPDIVVNLTGGTFIEDKINNITLLGDMVTNEFVSKGTIEYVDSTHAKINLNWANTPYYEDLPLTVNVPSSSYSSASTSGNTLTTDITCLASASSPASKITLDDTAIILTEADAYRKIGSLATNVVVGNRMDYYLDVKTAGEYTISYEVANSGGSPNAIKVSNGENTSILGNIASLSIGNLWGSMGVMKNTVILKAGVQTLRFEAGNSGFELKSIKITKKLAPQEIIGTSAGDKTTIAAENFFAGSKDKGYLIETKNGIKDVGCVVAGTYLDYSVDVKVAGKFQVDFNYGTASAATPVAVLQDGLGQELGRIVLIKNGSWENYLDTTNPMFVDLKAGIQTLRVFVEGDGFNYKNFSFTRIIDTTPPVITGHDGVILLGDNDANLLEALGIEAIDNLDGDITSNVMIDSSNLNYAKTGIYKVTATVSDISKNSSEAKIFNVTVKDDITPPVISGNNVIIGINSKFEPIKSLGIKVIDNKDGDITSKATIVSSVDTKTYGVYTVKVSVKDKALNKSERTLIVRVIDLTTVDVARAIITIPAPLKNQTKLMFPKMPIGYSLSIKSTNPTGIIAINGTITSPEIDTTVAVVFTVTNKVDGTTKDTVSINVLVPAKTSIDSIKYLILIYAKDGKLGNPIVAQLTNNLKQAQHQLDKGNYEQATKFMKDFIKHLNNGGLTKFIDHIVKDTLTNDAEDLIKLWHKK